MFGQPFRDHFTVRFSETHNTNQISNFSVSIPSGHVNKFVSKISIRNYSAFLRSQALDWECIPEAPVSQFSDRLPEILAAIDGWIARG
jgi:hypothetical protein